jgi:hypothetical protein
MGFFNLRAKTLTDEKPAPECHRLILKSIAHVSFRRHSATVMNPNIQFARKWFRFMQTAR